MNYRQAEEFLEARERLGIHLGTANVARLLGRLGDPHRAVPCLHVAGTNGKGSTARMMAGMLRASGRRTGLYISPHLLETRERIQVDNNPVTRRDFAAAVAAVAPHVEAQSRFLPHALTYYECLTAAAFVHFRAAGVDCAVIETGMGGRLDATNIVDPLAAVITPIGLDHQRFLGRTLAAVAGEKAGIIKPGRPVAAAAQPASARRVLRERAARLGVPYFEVGREMICTVTGHRDGRPVFTLEDRVGGGPGRLLTGLTVPLLGDWQAENAAAACLGLRAAGFALPEAAIRRGLRAARWPGRLMVLSRSPLVVFDVSHNPPGLRAMLPQLQRIFAGRPVTFVFGVLSDKDFRPMLRLLGAHGTRFFFTRPVSPRARSPEQLAAVFSRFCPGRPSTVVPEPEAAVREALGVLEPDGLLCICGSFYLAPVMRLFPGARRVRSG